MLQSSYDEIELNDKYACGDLEVIFGKAPTKATTLPEVIAQIKAITKPQKPVSTVEYYPPGFLSNQDGYYPPGKLKYYSVGGIEVIDYIKAKLTLEQYKGYLLGNIYKYSGRLQYKGEETKDITKLAEYTTWLKEHNVNNA